MTPSHVLLVNPRMCSPRSVRLPLSLLSLAAALEGKHTYRMVDGNLDVDATATVLGELAQRPEAAVAVSVMPGPQVGPAIAISRAVRQFYPRAPIVWGGYFPTLYPESAVNAGYVDYLVRGQGEETLLELLERLPDAGPPAGEADSASSAAAVRGLAGVTWKEVGEIRHNADRPLVSPDVFPRLPYERLGDLSPYLRPSFMGERTAVHQAAIGCRYHCEFCGVVSMFNGETLLQRAAGLVEAATTLQDRYGATAMQYYDHNFFDTEASSVPLLEAMAELAMPWFARTELD